MYLTSLLCVAFLYTLLMREFGGHIICSPVVLYPSCLQTTEASVLLQLSSHTVPHTPLRHTWTRPSWGPPPPNRPIAPLKQPHRTEASSLWLQSWLEAWTHEVSHDSVPKQATSSISTDPLPGPKCALLIAVAPLCINEKSRLKTVVCKEG